MTWWPRVDNKCEAAKAQNRRVLRSYYMYYTYIVNEIDILSKTLEPIVVDEIQSYARSYKIIQNVYTT